MRIHSLSPAIVPLLTCACLIGCSHQAKTVVKTRSTSTVVARQPVVTHAPKSASVAKAPPVAKPASVTKPPPVPQPAPVVEKTTTETQVTERVIEQEPVVK